MGLWCTNANTILCDSANHNLFIQTQLTAPPFDVHAYGLDDAFLAFSTSKKRASNPANAANEPPNKKRKIQSDDEKFKIPKMTEKISTDDTNSSAISICNADDREIIDIVSSESVSPPNPRKFKQQNISMINLV